MNSTAPSMAALQSLSSARSPNVSADAALLAYLSDESGFDQIWLAALAGGAPWRLTESDEPVGTLAFSPVGRDLIFTTDCGGDERHQLWLIPEASGPAVALDHDPSVLHLWGAWSPDGARIAYCSNARDRRHMDVHVMDMASREVHCVHQGNGFREVLAFFPDGEALLVRDARHSLSDQRLFRLDLASCHYTPLLQHQGRARYIAPRFVDNGQTLLMISDHGREFQGLVRYSLSTETLEWCVTFDDADIEAYALSPQRDRVAVAVNRDGWSVLVLHRFDDGTQRVIDGLPRGVITALSWPLLRDELLLCFESASRPSEIWRVDPQGGDAAPLTRSSRAGVDLDAFIEPSVERIVSFDGLTVPFFIYEPATPVPEAGYPVVVVVHGGPEAQWKPTFRADLQYMLARGIRVIAPNVRGSTGYGRRYQHLDDHELRMDSVADLEAVRGWIAEQGDVDQRRVAVYGRSYGGFMVLAALTEYPGRWALGIEFYGIANFLTLLETTGPWRRELRAAEYGDPQRHKIALERFSPIHRIAQIDVPLLIVHGMDDPRVPPGESEMVYACLRGLGRPVEYLRVAHAGHGFTRRKDRLRVFATLASFLERHL